MPIFGNEHQIPAADGHFLYVVTSRFSRFFSDSFSSFPESRSARLGG